MRATTSGRGFTILEVLISLGIFAIVSVLLMEMLARQSRTYTVVDNVAEAQAKARAVANLLEQEIRATGFLTPAAAALCGYDTKVNVPDADPDVLYVTNTEALTPPPPPGVPQPTNFQRSVQVVAAPGGVGSGTQTFTLASLVVDAPAFYDLNGDGVGDSDFRGPTAGAPGGGIMFFDAGDPTKGTACGQITAVSVATSTITVDFSSGGSIPSAGPGGAGTPMGAGPYTSLAAVPAHGYWINVAANGTPRLMRDGVVMAEDVEDLQLAAFFDANLDGIITGLSSTTPPPWNDANEYPGSNAPNSWYISGARNNRELREIRVTVVTRTRSQDPDTVLNPALANNFQQRPENRVVGVLAPDGFRRRALTMTITPRNVVSKL